MDFQPRFWVEEELANWKGSNCDKDAVPGGTKSARDLHCLQTQRGLRVPEFPSPPVRVLQGIIIDQPG